MVALASTSLASPAVVKELQVGVTNGACKANPNTCNTVRWSSPHKNLRLHADFAKSTGFRDLRLSSERCLCKLRVVSNQLYKTDITRL